MNIREDYELKEKDFLSPYASLAVNSKGRDIEEDQCPIRTIYQRDRDRIIHSKSFRRLKHKTQVYISPNSDHYRTRLTHTLEVSQIARTLARALRLNEDLTEAIAMGHDLGHTPFGHIGEEALNEVSSKGFKHNLQSLRIVEKLETRGNRKGLNLSFEVRDGIKNHTGPQAPSTLEGKIVKISDRIAYINHDIDDSIRAGLIREEDLPKISRQVLGTSHGDRINTLVFNIIENSLDKGDIIMDVEVEEATNILRDFMFTKVYKDKKVKQEAAKAKNILKELFFYYQVNPQDLPESYQSFISKDVLENTVCDYIAGMTDRYVMYIYQDIFIPKSWSVI